MSLTIKPIGYIRSPFKKREEAPFQGRFSKELSIIEISEEYEGALKDLELFNHIIVLYWANEASFTSFTVKTPHDETPRGLFATRSPNRPNPICLCVVELIKRRGRQLMVRGLDAIDGSPVIDIKPYIPIFDCHPDANMGWLSGRKIKLTRR